MLMVRTMGIWVPSNNSPTIEAMMAEKQVWMNPKFAMADPAM